jgi:ferrochelatase
MTYGEPSIGAALEAFDREQVKRVLVLPLYAQYSATSTAAALDAVFAGLRRQRWLPELRTINSYHDDDGYIEALAQSLRAHWQAHGEPAHLLMSFHSIPQQYVRAGDPYYCQCRKTARLLAEKLGLAAERWSASFQSRLGNQPWLQPYTDRVIPQLAARGVKTLDVICPGFAADCLETLEEVALRYRDDFLAAGGAEFRYVPALNDAPEHIDALSRLIGRHLQGWLLQPSPEDIEARLQRVAQAEPQLRSPDLLG